MFTGEYVQEKKKIPTLLKWLLAITIISIVTVFGGDMIQELLNPSPTSSDIVKNHYVRWETPLMVCDYKDYYNPTTKENVQVLSSVMEVKKGNVVNLGVEVLETVKTNRTVFTAEQWIPNYIWDEESKANVTIWDVVRNKTEIIEDTQTRWVKNITKFKPNTLYSIRQCFTRKNVLDNFEIDVSVPFLELPLKEFTIITSSGYNESIFLNISKVDLAINFNNNLSNSDLTGIHAVINNNSVQSITNGKYENGSSYTSASKQYLTWDKPRVPVNFTCNLWFNMSTAGSIVRESMLAMSDITGVAFEWTIEKSATLNQITSTFSRSGYGTVINTPSSYNDSTWHMATGVRRGSNNTLYIDGVRIGDSNINSVTEYTYGMSVGRLGIIPTNFYANVVDIDEVACWNSSFSTNEILSLFQNSNQSNISGYYPFDKYGAYNSTNTFNSVQFQFTPSSSCNYSMVNITQDFTTFINLNSNSYNFSTDINGFYLRVDTTKCSNIWMNVSFIGEINYNCNCDTTRNWNPRLNCTINSDCDIRPYNLSCATGNYLNITNGALVRFNTTNAGGFNCSTYIKSTGLLSG